MFKFNRDEKYKTIAFYAFLVIVTSSIVIAGLFNLSSIFGALRSFLGVLSPFIYGFIIAYLCNPFLNFYENHLFVFKKAKKNRAILRRACSVTLTCITAGVILSVISYAVIPQTIASINDLGTKLNSYLIELQKLADELTVKYSEHFFKTRYDSFAELLSDHEISISITDVLSGSFVIFRDGFDKLFSIGSRLVSEILNLLMGIFLAVYFLISKEKLCAQAKKLLAAVFSRRTYLNIIRLTRHTHTTFGGFIIGMLIDSTIIGILSFFILWALKMPYYPLLSVIIGITNIVPTFGPIFGGIIGSIIVFIVAPDLVIWFALLVLLIQQLDGNIIGPYILGDTIGIAPIWVLIAIVFASGLLGFWGMIIGVPGVAVIYTLVKQATERRLKAKNMPQSTEFYKTDPPVNDGLDSDQIFIDKSTEIPSIPPYEELPEHKKEKKPSLLRRIKNKLTHKQTKGRK